MKYNVENYRAKAVMARRSEKPGPRPAKTPAEQAADDERFSYDVNSGWSYKHKKTA